jgi:hypothetical protein
VRLDVAAIAPQHKRLRVGMVARAGGIEPSEPGRDLQKGEPLVSRVRGGGREAFDSMVPPLPLHSLAVTLTMPRPLQAFLPAHPYFAVARCDWAAQLFTLEQ